MSANRHADMTPTQRPMSRHGAMSPTWSVSCRRHSADMSACLSFWGGEIPDTTPTCPAKDITTQSFTQNGNDKEDDRHIEGNITTALNQDKVCEYVISAPIILFHIVHFSYNVLQPGYDYP